MRCVMCAQCASCDNDIFFFLSRFIVFLSSRNGFACFRSFFSRHTYDACFVSPFHVDCSSRMFTIYKINNYAPNRVYRTSCAQFHNKCESPNKSWQIFRSSADHFMCSPSHLSLSFSIVAIPLRFHFQHFLHSFIRPL